MLINNGARIANFKQPSFLNETALILNPCTGFNLTYQTLLDYTYYLVKYCHFSMHDLYATDYYFVDILMEKYKEELEEEAKRREEERQEQERQNAEMRQMYQYQQGNLPNYSSMPSNIG